MGVSQTAKDPKGIALRMIPMKAYWTCPDGAIHRKATRRRCPVTEPVKVSPVDVQRAKLLVRLNETLGKPSPSYVVKIAHAQPASKVRRVRGVSPA